MENIKQNFKWNVENISLHREPFRNDELEVKLKGVRKSRLYCDFFDPLYINELSDDIAYAMNNKNESLSSNKSITEIENFIEKVIFNKPATIVIWKDGTKTVVKVNDGDTFDPMVGLSMCISKKVLGNKGNYFEVFKKWCK